MSLEFIKTDLSQNPKCIHGPTFLVAEQYKRSTCRNYRCSLYPHKSAEMCQYVLAEEKINVINKKKAVKKLANGVFLNTRYIHLPALASILQEARLIDGYQRPYCINCNRFVTKKFQNVHKNHKVIIGVTDKLLSYPSKFLSLIGNDHRKDLFSDVVIQTTVKLLQQQMLTNIICVAIPKIHEYIQMKCKDMNSLLLDLDKRYTSFYERQKFCWYNLFNHYFFISESENDFKIFLKLDEGQKTALVIYPPPNGITESVTETLKTINKEFQKMNRTTRDLPILLYYPSSEEGAIKCNMPELNVTDFKISHNVESTQDNENESCPLVLFTNLNISNFQIDVNKYRYCETCKKMVYKNNKHCNVCNTCKSKDDQAYKHCAICMKCVEPDFLHCIVCNMCISQNHTCIKRTFQCFNCLETGHKIIACTKVDIEAEAEKRKIKQLKEEEVINKRIKLMGTMLCDFI